MNNRGGNNSGSFEVEERADATKLTNVIMAGLKESWDLIGKGNVFIKDEAKIASRVGGGQWGVVYFGQYCCLWAGILSWKSWELAVIQEEICCRVFWRLIFLSQSQVDERRRTVKCYLHKGGGWEKGKRWECCGEWCTWWKAKDQEQSPEEHCKKRSTRKIDACHIWHGRIEMTDKIWTS